MSQSLLLAELLRQYRTEARLSQEELAERAGVAARTIGDLETGVSLSPHAITISLISEALGLDAQCREALRSASRRRGLAVRRELPEAVVLIGREVELKSALSLLRDDSVRLVTLTGGPGVGKTALATAIAKELAPDYGERMRYIDFGNLPEATLVPTKILLAFGVRDAWGDSITHSIAAALAGRPMLMIADNFERVASAAPFIAELLAAAPQLKVLVASRVRTRLRAEHTVSVSWLSMESSLALLARRVRVWSPEFKPIQPDDSAFTALVKALGGVPLAIAGGAPFALRVGAGTGVSPAARTGRFGIPGSQQTHAATYDARCNQFKLHTARTQRATFVPEVGNLRAALRKRRRSRLRPTTRQAPIRCRRSERWRRFWIIVWRAPPPTALTKPSSKFTRWSASSPASCLNARESGKLRTCC